MTGKLLPGYTTNLSAGGALLEVDRPSLLVSGQKLEIGIAWNDHQAILEKDDLIQATVVRSFGLGGRQQVALQFEHRQQLSASA